MQNMTHAELRRRVLEYLATREKCPAQAWPQFGRDIILEEAEGPNGSLLYSFHTDISIANPLGIVHGGITAYLVDACMGVTCGGQRGGHTPTITMTVNYALPVPLDADIYVSVRTVRVGKTSGQMTAEVFEAGKPEKVLVTATGVYAVRR